MKKIFLPSMIFAFAIAVFASMSLVPSVSYGTTAAEQGAIDGAAAGNAHAEELYSPDDSGDEEEASSCG
jgi:hypothetical protein